MYIPIWEFKIEALRQVDTIKLSCNILLTQSALNFVLFIYLLFQVDASLGDFNKLSEEYNLVSTKTNALHSVSEQLLADQMKLHSISEEIKKKLHLFSQVENLSQRLNSPTLSVSSAAFFAILTKIDECMDYLKSNVS